ncbi:hypothetical protein [Actinoplanes sp. NPDC026619]|uniref:hypothetical protein n=1 Tax=Actinoplanes sp. NPDC026619 TaxID=3155798 RepID=UPI0033FA9E70
MTEAAGSLGTGETTTAARTPTQAGQATGPRIERRISQATVAPTAISTAAVQRVDICQAEPEYVSTWMPLAPPTRTSTAHQGRKALARTSRPETVTALSRHPNPIPGL